MGQFSLTHILILALILIVLFRPSKLGQLGQGLGRAIRGFKDGLKGVDPDSQNEQRQVGSSRDKKENQDF